MNWRKTLFIFLGLPLAAYGVVQSFLWLTIKNHAEDIKQTLAPLANFEYGRIHALPWAPLGIGDISITPHALDDTIRIGGILTRFDTPADLYDLVKASYNDEPPAKLKLSIERIVLPLDGDIANMLNSQAATPSTIPSSFGCADRVQFDADDLQAMGYDKLTLDIRTDFGRNRRTQTFNLHTRVRIRDMMSFAFEGSLPEAEAPTTLGPAALLAPPKLAGLSFSYEDDSYTTRKNEYCASLSGLSVAEYVDRHVESVVDFLAENDFVPSDELIAAYRQFLNKQSRITVSLNPYEPMDLQGLALMGESDWMETLGLEVSFDDKLIQNLGSQQLPMEQEVAETENGKPKAVPDTYKPTPLADLGQHLNRKVRIRTRDGKQHSAYLDRVESGKLILTRHLVGGQATFTVPVSSVNEIFVLR